MEIERLLARRLAHWRWGMGLWSREWMTMANMAEHGLGRGFRSGERWAERCRREREGVRAKRT